MSREQILEILSNHFPPKWKNEGLKERVIEFGEDVYRAAIEDAAKAVEPFSQFTAAEIRKKRGAE